MFPNGTTLNMYKKFILKHEIKKQHLLMILIIFFEVLKTFFNQSIYKSVFNCCLFFLVFCTTNCYPLMTFLVLVYQGFEVVSYVMCGTPTSLRVINSIDFKWAIIYHPITFLLLIFVAVIFFMISYCRCGIPTNEDKNNYYTEILKYIIFILFFAFILNCYYYLH